MKRKNVTLSDIAEKMGLDKSSISLALRNSPKVSEQTRKRILNTALEMGYRPNVAARQLSSDAPQVIGIVNTPSFMSLASEVAADAVRVISSMASKDGILCNMLSSTDLLKAKEDPSIFTILPDGFLVWGDIPLEEYNDIISLRRPSVLLDPNHASYTDFSGISVSVDNGQGAASVIREFEKKNAQRLLVVQSVNDHTGHIRRREGAREVWLASHPLSSFSSCLYNELTDDHLKEFSTVTPGAIFCTNDLGALSIWHRLLSIGVSVPKDIMLAGFDGEKPGRALGLTSAFFDGEELGRAGYALLMKMISEDTVTSESVVLPVSLQNGETV